MGESVCRGIFRASFLSGLPSRHCLHGTDYGGGRLHETRIPPAGIVYPSMTSSARLLLERYIQNLLGHQKTRPSPSSSSQTACINEQQLSLLLHPIDVPIVGLKVSLHMIRMFVQRNVESRLA